MVWRIGNNHNPGHNHAGHIGGARGARADGNRGDWLVLSYIGTGGGGGPMASFGTRQFPLGTGEHVISLFAVPEAEETGKQFGVNGRPGDIYTVPAGRKLTIYQMDINGFQAGAQIPNGTVILMDSEPDGTTRTDVAAFYPDRIAITPYDNNDAQNYLAMFSEKNDINRPFVAGRQPRCRLSTPFMLGASLELYGIEGPA